MNNLVRNLPHDGALHRVLGDGWVQDDHLAVTTIEMLHNVFRAVVGLGGKKTDPLKIQRPSGATEQASRPRDFFRRMEVLARNGGR